MEPADGNDNDGNSSDDGHSAVHHPEAAGGRKALRALQQRMRRLRRANEAQAALTSKLGRPPTLYTLRDAAGAPKSSDSPAPATQAAPADASQRKGAAEGPGAGAGAGVTADGTDAAPSRPPKLAEQQQQQLALVALRRKKEEQQWAYRKNGCMHPLGDNAVGPEAGDCFQRLSAFLDDVTSSSQQLEELTEAARLSPEVNAKLQMYPIGDRVLLLAASLLSKTPLSVDNAHNTAIIRKCVQRLRGWAW